MLDEAEESLFFQRSNVTWLDLGDSNTAYFNRMVSTRNSYNLIHYLVDVNGNKSQTEIKSQAGIEEHCISSFSGLLGGPVEPQMFEQSDINLIMNYSCTVEQQRSLVKPFFKEEIKAAFFSLPRNKTSGPDGYSSEFFMACWDVVGVEVIDAVSEIFQTGRLLKQWNATASVLISKITNAFVTSDFIPISCLNTM